MNQYKLIKRALKARGVEFLQTIGVLECDEPHGRVRYEAWIHSGGKGTLIVSTDEQGMAGLYTFRGRNGDPVSSDLAYIEQRWPLGETLGDLLRGCCPSCGHSAANPSEGCQDCAIRFPNPQPPTPNPVAGGDS